MVISGCSAGRMMRGGGAVGNGKTRRERLLTILTHTGIGKCCAEIVNEPETA